MEPAAAIQQAPATPPTSPPDPSRVHGNVECAVCRYNLAGIAIDGVCPECNTPVKRSAYGDLFRYAPKGYVKRLNRGVRLVLWGSILLSLVILVEVGFTLANELLDEYYESSWLIAILALGGLLVWTVGWFVATAREPGVLAERRKTNRIVLRAALIVMVCSWLPLGVLVALEELGSAPAISPDFGSGMMMIMLIAGAMWLSSVVVCIVGAVRLMNLARRVEGRHGFAGIRLSMILGIAGTVIMFVLSSFSGDDVVSSIAITVVGTVITAIWLLACRSLAKALRREIAQSVDWTPAPAVDAQ